MSIYKLPKIPELTDEEKKSPYTQFYYEPILPPAPEVLAAIQPGKPIDPSVALAPKDIGKLFVPGSLKVNNGYCKFSDGTGFSIIYTKGPNTTIEMERWWTGWYQSPDYNYFNYKVWMPGFHFTHANPVKFHQVKPIKIEDLDLPASPTELNPKYFRAGGTAANIVPDTPGGVLYYATLLHYFTLGAEGIDTITCVWSGIHILDGKPVRMIGKNEQVDLECVRLFACHNAWESARKVRILPKLYAYYRTLN